MIPTNLAPHLFDYAVNTLWQLPLLAAATWLLIRLSRANSHAQHLLWIATLLLATLIPLHGNATYIQATNSSVTHSSTLPSSMSRSTEAPQPPSAPLPLFTPHQIPITPTLLTTLVRLWLLAFAINLLRFTFAWIASRRLIASANADPEALDFAFLQSCAARLQIPIPEIRFLNSPSATPVVAGIFHPILLLPRHLAHDYELTAILLHEFAHIRRRDTLANALCRIIALPIAWHPVTPLLHARIIQTREILCDALAAQATGSPTAYARSLLTLARNLTQLNDPGIATLGLFPSTRTSTPRNSSALEERIMNLITPTSPRLSHRTIRIAAGVALVTAATLTAAAFHLQPASAAERRTSTAPLVPVYSRTSTTDWKLAYRPSTILKPYAPTTYSSDDDGATWQAVPAALPAAVTSTPASVASAPLPPLPAPPSTMAIVPLAPLAPAAPTLPAPYASLPAPLPPLSPLSAAPQAAPAPPPPAPIPAPDPTPAPRVFYATPGHPITVVHGVVHEMTPEEQAEFDKQLAAMRLQVQKLQTDRHFDGKQLNAQLKALNSPEFKRQIAEAQKFAVEKTINSDEIRKQLDEAIRQINVSEATIADQKLDIRIDQAEIQAQIRAATDALAHIKFDTNIHIDTAEIQRQLDQAQHQIDEARKHLKDSNLQP